MRMTKILKLLSLSLMLAMAASLFAACNEKGTETTTTESTTTAAPTQTTTKEATTESTRFRQDTPLVVGYAEFSGKFSPFYADTVYDMDVANMTSVALLTTDRTGAIVYNAIEGETIPYAGTDYEYTGIANIEVNYDEDADETVYTWTLRDDVQFSDGELLTADDVIFSYYVFCDPAYTGSSTLYSVPIIGVKDYRTQTTSEVYEKYYDLFYEIYKTGRDYEWSEDDNWTEEQQTSLWEMIKTAWIDDIQAIVDYCLANGMHLAEKRTGYTPEEINKEEGLQIMFGMVLWEFAEVGEDGVLSSVYSDNTWNLPEGEYPTIEDYYNEAYIAYEGNPEYYWVENNSNLDSDSIVDKAREKFILEWGPKDESMGGEGISNIEGIKKLSDTVVEVTVSGFDATAIYKLGTTVAPLHYYGDESKYDYDNNQFGFDFGDLSTVQTKTTYPMGAGPYKFIKYENKVVYFEANEYYYKGEPIINNLHFKETADTDKISGVGTDTIDIVDISFGTEDVEEIRSYNSNEEVSGDKIITITVDNPSYGFIGINAGAVNVAGDPASEESKNLRKGLATVLASYRDLTVDTYYGERASVINYPISNTSWAAPQPSDPGYKAAFSTTLDGSDIYTLDMSSDDRYEAALDAAVEYFVAAGYAYDEASGKLTAAPEGASLEYEAIISANGTGNHPSFRLLAKAKEALETIGISLRINDLTSANKLWDDLNAGSQEIFCLTSVANIDPDMYQRYHSNNVVGVLGSTESNYFNIMDPELDKLIMAARKSDDQAYRKKIYKDCLDIIIDWAVEIPVYQQKNAIIFSAERINMDTVTPDITTFWGWMHDIELLQMN